MNRLGNTSKKRLSTCNDDIKLTIEESIKICPIDFGVAQGERTVEQQQEYYDKGKSQVNPKAYDKIETLLQKGKHIVDGIIRKKSDAVDLYAYVNGRANWSTPNLCIVAGTVLSVNTRLYAEGKIKTKLRWGGNWDMDGEIITDQRFQDLPHFETIT